jgi:hypothetical protein
MNAQQMASTYRYEYAIIALLYFIPGFISGLILNYEGLLEFAKSRSRNIDIRYLLLALFLVIAGSYPMWVYFYPITSFSLPNFHIMISPTFQFTLSLLCGYSASRSFTIKE